MKIVCVGCSFTDGRVTGIKSVDELYPYSLQQLLPGYTVYNLGFQSASQFFIYKMMKDAIEQLNPDIIIRQITPPYRSFMYNTDKKLNLMEHVKEEAPNYFSVDRGIYNDVRMFNYSSTIGNLYSEREARRSHAAYYKTTHPDIMFEQSEAFLLAGNKLLEGQKSITFSFLNSSTYLDYPSIENVVGFNNDYLVDAAGHFNNIGNRKLARYVARRINRSEFDK